MGGMRPSLRPPGSLARAALAALVAMGATGATLGDRRAARGEDGPPAEGAGSPTGCVVPVFVEEDATLVRAYDGLRLGLEEANLPRACRAPLAEGDGAGRYRVAPATAASARAAGATFVVAMGREAAAAVARTAFVGAPDDLPKVYVDLTLSLGGVPLAPPPTTAGRAAVVRAEVPIERVAALVRDLLPGRPRPVARIALDDPPADVEAWLRRAEAVTSVRFVTAATERPDILVDVGSWGGGPTRHFTELLALARSLPAPVVSTSRAWFGQGAAVVVVPDAALLGRAAAEAARRLLLPRAAGEGAPAPPSSAPLVFPVRTTEVWVDLEAAAAAGFDPPLAFLARVDRVRRPRAPEATAPGPRR